MHLRLGGPLVVLLMLGALAACGGGGSGGSSGTPSAPATSASSNTLIPPTAMSQTGPSFGGYTPNYWYPANNASPLPNEPPATLTTSTTAIANLPGAAITGTQLANFTISYSVTLTFQGCPWFSPVTVPGSISTAASHQFFEYTYDLTANTALTACNPTGFSVTGQSITFTGFQEAGPTPPPGSTVEPSTYVQTFTAGHKYVVVLTGT